MRDYREWTKHEEQAMVKLSCLGLDHVSLALARSKDSIKSKAKRLRAEGVEIVFGSDDAIDATQMTPAGVIDSIRASVSQPICPGCGNRPASVIATGLCARCHYERVVEDRRERLDVLIARRRLDVMRQRKHRLRICESCLAAFYPRKSSPTTICPRCEG